MKRFERWSEYVQDFFVQDLSSFRPNPFIYLAYILNPKFIPVFHSTNIKHLLRASSDWFLYQFYNLPFLKWMLQGNFSYYPCWQECPFCFVPESFIWIQSKLRILITIKNSWWFLCFHLPISLPLFCSQNHAPSSGFSGRRTIKCGLVSLPLPTSPHRKPCCSCENDPCLFLVVLLSWLWLFFQWGVNSFFTMIPNPARDTAAIITKHHIA